MENTSKMNVIEIDDKFYAKKVKNATCNKKVNGVYYLKCEIKMRGNHYYYYEKGNNYIIKDSFGRDGKIKSKNILYLLDDALNTILNAISIMDNYIELLNEKGYKYDLNNSLYYERRPDMKYFFIHKNECTKGIVYSYGEEYIYKNNYHDELSRDDFINDNIYYLAAKSNNDEIFMLELLVRENLATNDECKRLSGLTGRTILPKADIKYNKTFVVHRDGIDVDVLDQSGYRILHRPYFAMKGSTHDKWELNPYTKTGVDAAMKDDEAISFTELLAILN